MFVLKKMSTRVIQLNNLGAPFRTKSVRVYLSADGGGPNEYWGWFTANDVAALTGMSKSKTRHLIKKYRLKHTTLTETQAPNTTWFLELGTLARLMKSTFPLNQNVWDSKECIEDAIEYLINAIEAACPDIDLCLTPVAEKEEKESSLRKRLRETTEKYIDARIREADDEIKGYAQSREHDNVVAVRVHVQEYKQAAKKKRSDQQMVYQQQYDDERALVKVAEMLSNTSRRHRK